ncbi:MAG: hypothetical protein A3E84_04320 [Gammaproteobacteria bacterium RIFCSPHIGHO2_12_FULL_42_13]|nr:MAG: hypothetical protein A3E84_04320 [Gammaproteobacteria bacterium RIFCSPHIGHO2_12_FULL_42_13]
MKKLVLAVVGLLIGLSWNVVGFASVISCGNITKDVNAIYSNCKACSWTVWTDNSTWSAQCTVANCSCSPTTDSMGGPQTGVFISGVGKYGSPSGQSCSVTGEDIKTCSDAMAALGQYQQQHPHCSQLSAWTSGASGYSCTDAGPSSTPTTYTCSPDWNYVKITGGDSSIPPCEGAFTASNCAQCFPNQ